MNSGRIVRSPFSAFLVRSARDRGRDSSSANRENSLLSREVKRQKLFCVLPGRGIHIGPRTRHNQFSNWTGTEAPPEPSPRHDHNTFRHATQVALSSTCLCLCSGSSEPSPTAAEAT